MQCVLAWIGIPFSWTTHNLSILGEQGSLRSLFNWGLTISGVFYLILTLGLYKNVLVDKTGRYGLICLIGSAVTLSLTGIFPRTIEVPHDVFSVGFFVLVTAFFFLRSWDWTLFQEKEFLKKALLTRAFIR